MPHSNAHPRFPELVPETPPAVRCTFGFGQRFVSRRDFDPESETFTADRVFYFAGFPLRRFDAWAFGVGASPYAPNDHRTAALGRVPLSTRARVLNVVWPVVFASLVWLAVEFVRSRDPDYGPASRLAAADARLEEGDLAAAFDGYLAVAAGTTPSAEAARTRIASLPDDFAAAGTPAAYRVMVRANAEPLTVRAGLFDKSALVRALDRLADAALNGEVALSLIDGYARLSGDPAAFAATRRRTVERLRAADPSSPQLAVEYARCVEQAEGAAAAAAALKGFEDRVALGEGLRILGAAALARGDLAEGVARLDAYCKPRLAALADAAEKLELRHREAAERTARRLDRDGLPPEARKELAAVRDDAARDALLSRILLQETSRAPEIVAVVDAYAAATEVVPTALELGAALARRAGELQGAERTAAAKRAEEVLTAVRAQAGDEADFRLAAAAAKFLLGDSDAGLKLLDGLVEESGRAPQVVLAAALTLREVGATEKARKWAEEAYDRATDRDERYAAAGLLAAMADTDESVEKWSARCDPALDATSAMRLQSDGRRALSQGRRADAVAKLRAAADAWLRRAPQHAALNNAAVARLEAATHSGSLADYAAALAAAESAAAADAGNAIAQSTLASALAASVRRRLLGDRLADATIGTVGLAAASAFVEEPDADEDAADRTFVASPEFRRIRDLAGRVRAGRAADPDAAATYVDALALAEDLDALRREVARLADARFDFDENVRRYAEAAEPKDADDRRRAEARLSEIEALRDAAGTAPDRACLTVAAALARLDLETGEGGSGDLDHAIAAVEGARAVRPSRATKATLVELRLKRAVAGVRSRFPALDEALRKHDDRFGYERVAVVCAERDPALRTALLERPDLAPLRERTIETARRRPRAIDPTDWRWLRLFDPELAAEAARALATNESAGLVIAARSRLEPYDGARVLDAIWLREAAGDVEGAARVRSEAASRGVVLP